MRITEFRLKLYVKDMASNRHFYEDIIGFKIVNSWDNGPDDQGIMFDTGSGIIELIFAGNRHVPIQGCDVSLEVDDVHSLWEQLRIVGRIVHPLRDNAWGDTSFCLTDPEGFEVTFFTKH